MKCQVREKILHRRFPMDKKFCALCPVCNIAKLCDLCELCRVGSVERAQPFVGKAQKDIIGAQNPQIKHIGKVIDIRIVIVKEMPIALFVFAHVLPRRKIRCTVARKKYNDRLRFVICCEHIINGRLFIPNKVILDEKNNPHLTLCMWAIMRFCQVILGDIGVEIRFFLHTITSLLPICPHVPLYRRKRP